MCVCAVEAEFLGLVSVEGRVAVEDRNKEVYGTVILLQLNFLATGPRANFSIT